MGNSRIQLRRGKAAFWTDENPVLHPGEPGFETDTEKLKIGDGKTHWRELDYFVDGGGTNGNGETRIRQALQVHKVPKAQKDPKAIQEYEAQLGCKVHPAPKDLRVNQDTPKALKAQAR